MLTEYDKAPFPWFGGKSRASGLLWQRFGAVRNYVEPFAGSLATLLTRPGTVTGPETVNDLDGLLVNFWRAVRAEPETVAMAADWPVMECVPTGTLIATPAGNVPVESIMPGMTVWGGREGQLVPTAAYAAPLAYDYLADLPGPERTTEELLNRLALHVGREQFPPIGQRRDASVDWRIAAMNARFDVGEARRRNIYAQLRRH
jgi:hypothetical protein